jgi:hypothetical protein
MTKITKPQLVTNVPTVADAEEQVYMVKDMLEECEGNPERTKELHASLLRAHMVLNTKKIALSPEEQQELRALGRIKQHA